MKLFFFASSLIFISLFASQALAASESINNYQVGINILEDSTLQVKELIEYNFSTNQKHGIYRDIPILKKKLSEIPFKIYDVKVVDIKGNNYNYVLSRNGSDINIKIGLKDKYVTGIKTYIISYKVQGAFAFGEERDSLFWDSIGTGWKVPILKSSVRIFLPKPISKEKMGIDYYFGFEGSANKLTGEVLREQLSKVYEASIRIPVLKAYQGVTFNLFLDKNIVTQAPPPNIIMAYTKRYGFGLLPIITFFVMFYIWYYKGRDPKGRGNIIVQYSPPEDMMPAELGTIYDERVNNKDISADIIYLAIQGYLKIKRIKKSHIFSKEDYVLEKLKEPNDLSRQYQIDLINNLFVLDATTVKLSSLKKKAYIWMKEIEKDIYKLVTKQGYFYKNPQKSRKFYAIIAGIVIIIINFFSGTIFSLFSDTFTAVFAFFSILFSFIIIIAFGYQMVKKTNKGVLAKEYILGLREYINVAEKERIKFHNAPIKDPQIFEKLLPYAMAFGLEKKWAKQFEGIYMQEPSWYVSGQTASFSAINFGASLSGFRAATSNASSSSSSGGSVGGGGGGGGGGSW